ncbi:LXG domain of WXG superfamily protein [Streptococcus intermedius BA1]|uniref:T7SS effector LXG polymorphic toxin n=1 Tax=Streptococcus intermedius TaxID=1338 RepID=UPI00029C1153|nr:T7SS effector LXG polymorphic toxin [Streptococcus intermedius]EKU16710.1 LXG domain of WXG superfamily protein [Streptococcus intermedius BA1]
MSFHIDMSELNQAHARYLAMSEEVQEELEVSKKSMNRIIESNTLYGEVGQAVANEINHFHNPYLIGLKDSLFLLDQEYSQLISDFKKQTGETDENAILNEKVLRHLVATLGQIESHQNSETNAFNTIYRSIEDLLPLRAPSSSDVTQAMSEARSYLQETITRVQQFDQLGQSQAETLLSGLERSLTGLGQTSKLSYTDPDLVRFLAQDGLSQSIKNLDDQIVKAKKEAELAAKEAAKRQQKRWAKHHPLQAMVKETADSIGSWWAQVVKGTRGLPIPVVKEVALFSEGLVFKAGELLGSTAIGVLDLAQLAVSGGVIAAHYSSGQLALTPQWMTEDWAGTAKQFQSLGRQIKGMYLMQYDPAAVVRYEAGLFDANACLAHESQKNLEGLGQQFQQELTRGDFYTYGKYTFDVASLFIGGAEIKGALNGTKIGRKTLEGLTAFKNMSRAALAKNSSQMVTKIERLLQYGDDTIKALTNKILDTPFQVGDELAHAGANHSKTSTTLREFFKERGVVFGKADGVSNVEVKSKKQLQVLDGKVNKIPLEEYEYYRLKSIHNPDSDTMTLGKYEPTIRPDGTPDWSTPGPNSYISKAGDTTYFSLGDDWNKLTEAYHLDSQGRQMFEAFNKPALDDAVAQGKTIRFSHDPELPQYEKSAIRWEWDYLREQHGYKRLKLKGGYRYGIK